MGSRLAQPLKFILVGIAGFVLNLCVFTALFGIGTWYVAASLVAFFVSNGAMYVGNRYFTFRLLHEGFWAAYARYVLVGALVAALTAALLAAQVEGVGADPRVGQAVALAALTPLAFLLNKRWTFRLRPA